MADDAVVPGTTPDAFDAVKFRTELLAEFNKGLNGALKALKTELKPPAADPPEDPQPDPGDKTDPKVKALEKKLADLATKYDAAEKSRQETEARAKQERLSGSLRTELLKFVAPERVESALRIFGPDVRYAEDGAMIGGADETPLAEFVAAAITKHEYLMPPKQVGGAGATTGNRRGQPAVTLDDIKPGMTKEQEAAALLSIRQFLPGQQ